MKKVFRKQQKVLENFVSFTFHSENATQSGLEPIESLHAADYPICCIATSSSHNLQLWSPPYASIALSFHHCNFFVQHFRRVTKLFSFPRREIFNLWWIARLNWNYHQLNNTNYRKFWTRSSNNLNEMFSGESSSHMMLLLLFLLSVMQR